jgi:hypothetical protein
MSSLLNFLNRVLPPESDGERCWFAAKKGQGVKQGFASTNEQLSIAITGIDVNKWDAYFACASYKTRDNRKSENTQSVKSFWMDVDAGKGKVYADREIAEESLHLFLDTTGLPNPSLLVCSGNGLHVYWCLGDPVTPEQWLPIAKRLKTLAEQHGFDADPSRTADLASILRPPQTMNWKNPEEPKEVYIIEENDDVNFEDFCAAVNGTTPAVPNFSLGDMPKGPPSFTQGYGDGERTQALTHRAGWCVGPGKMHEEDAIKSCLEWNENNTPPLDEDKVISTVRSIAKREETKPSAPGAPPLPFEKPSENLPPLPPSYKWGNRMEIMGQTKNPDYDGTNPNIPEHMDVIICEYPFFVESLREEETHGVAGNQSVKITSKSPHAPWKSFVISRKELMGPSWTGSLGAYGVVCEPGQEKSFRSLLHKMIQTRSRTVMPETSYKSFGWKNNRSEFISGRRCFMKGNITTVSGTIEFEKVSDLLTPKTKGSINKWRAAANRVFAPGCEAQALSMMASFAAPLMDLLFTGEEGGTIMSLISSESGQGKTTAILAAETVWGQVNCLRITERESSAAQFRAIGVRSNLPIVIDEWGSMDIDSVRDRVATFTGGLDKKRLTITGEDTREQLSWKTVMIGTTNLPIVNLLHANNYGPQAMRIFEIPVSIPVHLSKTQSSTLNREFEENAGFAGPIFLAYLLNNFDLETLKERINKLAEEFGLRCGANTDERYKTRLMAAIAMAAVILSKPMINGEPMLDFSPSRLIDFGLAIIKDGKTAYTGKKDAAEHLMDFIRDNMQNYLSVDGPFNNKKPYCDITLPRQQLVGRYEQSNAKLYIPHDLIHKFAVSIRQPYAEFSKKLTDMGLVLNRNRRTLLTAGVEKLSPVMSSCWEIDLTHESAGGIKQGLELEIKDMSINSKLKPRRF